MWKSFSPGGVTILVSVLKQILNTSVPYVTDIEKMGLYRQPVPAYLPDSKAGKTYTDLWQEIEEELLKLFS